MISLRSFRVLPLFVLILISLIFLFSYFGTPVSNVLGTFSSSGRKSSITPANATLGFGGIFVVSGLVSSRRPHLEQAAAITELNLTIPEQIIWTEEDLDKFRGSVGEESRTNSGSIKSWLSHHLVLRAFLESGVETGLIIENDVDWDIRLRTQAVPLTQRATRKLFSTRLSASEEQIYPWGKPKDWDLLYLGHCGDYFGPTNQPIGIGHHHPDQLKYLPHVIFEDDSLPYYTDLHPWTASLLTAFRVPERNRVMHRSVSPLCTFGYAITRESARKILEEVAPASSERNHNKEAYDVAIREGCDPDPKRGTIRCYSLQPELFHHMSGASIIGIMNGNPWPAPVDEKGSEQSAWRGETSNIRCGFASGDFYYDDDGENKLEYLREEVGRKGKCLKPGKY